MDSLEPISAVERDARLERVVAIARRLGFVGEVEYRHATSSSGGAMFCLAPTVEQDLLVVFAEAFRRDAAGDDFSLEAIIAHERGHQFLHRHKRFQRVKPKEMSNVTEEVLASVAGALITPDPHDSKLLELKALCELVDHGMSLSEASRRVEETMDLLRSIL